MVLLEEKLDKKRPTIIPDNLLETAESGLNTDVENEEPPAKKSKKKVSKSSAREVIFLCYKFILSFN